MTLDTAYKKWLETTYCFNDPEQGLHCGRHGNTPQGCCHCGEKYVPKEN